MAILGVDRRSMPCEMSPNLSIDFKVVLVQGDNNDVAAYRGAGSEDFVMRCGDKLKPQEAECHFPGLAKTLEAQGLTYRWD